MESSHWIICRKCIKNAFVYGLTALTVRVSPLKTINKCYKLTVRFDLLAIMMMNDYEKCKDVYHCLFYGCDSMRNLIG